MSHECKECGEELEEGDKFIAVETHQGYIKDGWLHQPAHSLMSDDIYCPKCYRQM